MRGKRAKKRKMNPDPKFGNEDLTKFINYIMIDGKKDLATSLVYQALDKLGKETKMEPIEAFQKAVENIKPKMEVRSRRVGGANYQVPMPVKPDRQNQLAFRWIIKAARESRKSKPFAETLAIVLRDAIDKQGAAYKKKEEVHKMAESNKAFAHFQW